MLVGLFLIANFTANVTSELTYQRIQGTIRGPDDLHGKHVVTVEGTTADLWLTDQQINHSTVETIDDAYALLDKRIAQAIVYDAPELAFEVLQNPDKGYTIPATTFNTEEYGIAFPAGSPLREEINRALLRLIEDGTYDRIYAKWYGLVFN
jgi:polar amino acid transport system substrate-binding protein